MRSISACCNLESSFSMTQRERNAFAKWLDLTARYTYDSCDYCYLLGWFVLDDQIPLSPKEAGFDNIKDYSKEEL